MRSHARVRTLRLLGLASLALAAPLFLHAQEWTTSGHDAQRTGAIGDPLLTEDAITTGQFKFLWKQKFDNEAHGLNALTAPVLLDRLIGYRGFKTLAFMGGSDDRVFAIDTDLARPYWTTVLNYSAATGGKPVSSLECPGGLIAAPSRRTALAPPAGRRGGGGGRGGRLGSAVGEPGKGAAVLAQMAAQGARGPAGAAGQGRRGAAPGAPAAAGGRAAGRGVGAVPFGGVDPLFVLSSDGMLHTLRVSDGADAAPPAQFIPPDAKPSSLIWVDGVVYTTTSGNCGAAPDALWSIDLTAPEKDRKVLSWASGGASIAGDPGVALGPQGTIYVAVGKANAPNAKYADSVVALDGATLEPKDWFTAPGADFNTSPIVFRDKDRDVVAVAGNDGRLYLLDGASLGGSDHKTPLAVSRTYSSSGAGAALATWVDQGTRWIAAPAAGGAAPPSAAKVPAPAAAGNGRIVAFKIADSGSSLSIESGWQSRELVSPLAPIVVNGMVFAVSSGEYRPASGAAHVTAAQRAQRSTGAVLYVLDAASGKALWNSGTTIGSFARGALAAGGGQVYLVTYDNHLYAFGIPMEH